MTTEFVVVSLVGIITQSEAKIKEVNMAKGINIQWRVYKYAPEQTTVWVNGKVFAKQYTELASKIGNTVLTKGNKAAEDMIIRKVRELRKRRRKVTFGFFGINGSRQYYYTRQLEAYNDDFQEKLRIYKEWKRYCKERNCDLITHEITTGEFTPYGMEKKEVTQSSDVVDLKRPMKIRWKESEVF